MRVSAVCSFVLALIFSSLVSANGNKMLKTNSTGKDSLSKSNEMAIEVNVPQAHTIETELGFVEDGGVLFTRQSEVTVFGSVKTSNKLQMVIINGRKTKFIPEGDRYKFHRKIHLEDEYNTIKVSVTDSRNIVKDMSFTICLKSD